MTFQVYPSIPRKFAFIKIPPSISCIPIFNQYKKKIPPPKNQNQKEVDWSKKPGESEFLSDSLLARRNRSDYKFVDVPLTINRAPERDPLKDESVGVDIGEGGRGGVRAENLLMPRVMEMYRCRRLRGSRN